MSIRNSLLMSLVVAASGAAIVFGQGPTPVSRRYVFPPVSLANGETAQLNVANVGSNAASCTGSIILSNPGGPVTDPFPFTVSGGQIVSVGFPNNSANRVQILAYVSANAAIPPTAILNNPCSLVFSLELFGNNTHLILANPTLVPAQARGANQP
jgi:hypothetical protein